MNHTLKIPEKVKKYHIKAGEYVTIDTMGLSCILGTSDKAVYIKAKHGEDDKDAFTLNVGERIEFCSDSLVVFADGDADVCCIFFSTL